MHFDLNTKLSSKHVALIDIYLDIHSYKIIKKKLLGEALYVI